MSDFTSISEHQRSGSDVTAFQQPPMVCAQEARLLDPLGHQIHTALAALFLFTLPLAPAPQGFAFFLLLGCAVIRLPHTLPTYRGILGIPVLICLLVWSAWHLTTLFWSTDVKQGWDEFGPQRMFLIPALLLPVLDRLPWLIGAALLGVAAQNVAQLVQAMEWIKLRPQEGEGRYGGLMHPIKTGAWCVAAMCWHLSAIMRGSHRVRLISLLGLIAASAGLIAAASRGTWLAAAVALPLMLLFTAIRRPNLRRATLFALVIGTLLGAIAWPFIKEPVVSRSAKAAEEARAARDEHIYWTSVGLRIGMMRWALDMFAEHPLVGIGAGSYRKAQSEHPDYQAGLAQAADDHERKKMTKGHPHSIYWYTLACTGVVGALILLAFIALLIRQCWIDPPNHFYAEGSFFIVVSWLIGAQFDCYNLDGHRLGLLMVVVAATLPGRAMLRLHWRAADEGKLQTAHQPSNQILQKQAQAIP